MLRERDKNETGRCDAHMMVGEILSQGFCPACNVSGFELTRRVTSRSIGKRFHHVNHSNPFIVEPVSSDITSASLLLLCATAVFSSHAHEIGTNA